MKTTLYSLALGELLHQLPGLIAGSLIPEDQRVVQFSNNMKICYKVQQREE